MPDAQPKRPTYTQISRPHKGVEVEVRRQERRLKLIEAGLETLGTKGYHATTVRDVCGQAGLSERYFYESFTNLGALFDTIYQQLLQDWMGRQMSLFISARNQNLPPMEIAKSALAAWLTYMKEDPRRARIMLIDAIGANDSSVRGAQAATRDYVGTMQTIIELLYPDLPAQGRSPRLLATILTGGCIHAVKDWAWTNFEASEEVVIEHLLMVFRGLDMQYLRPDGPTPTSPHKN